MKVFPLNKICKALQRTKIIFFLNLRIYKILSFKAKQRVRQHCVPSYVIISPSIELFREKKSLQLSFFYECYQMYYSLKCNDGEIVLAPCFFFSSSKKLFLKMKVYHQKMSQIFKNAHIVLY
jgi:hypothetical protein